MAPQGSTLLAVRKPPLFSRKPPTDEYDREAILQAAEKAERKGDRARAIAEYEKVLRWEPENLVLRTKIAILLGQADRAADAAPHFVAAGEGYVRDGFVD